MVGKIDKTPKSNIYQVPLKQFIKEDHELVILSQKIDWDYLDSELSKFYCADNGRPGIPIRKISGILMLKRMFNESVLVRWVENPYWQYFCGEVTFQHDLPFDRNELIKFRQRIGEEGQYCSEENQDHSRQDDKGTVTRYESNSKREVLSC